MVHLPRIKSAPTLINDGETTSDPPKVIRKLHTAICPKVLSLWQRCVYHSAQGVCKITTRKAARNLAKRDFN